MSNWLKSVFSRLSKAMQSVTANDAIRAEPRNWQAARQSVARLTDQELLLKVASNAGGPDVRAEALKKLTDQEQIAHIALTDKAPGNRSWAILMLTDQSLLEKLALEGKEKHERREAFSRLTNPSAELRARFAPPPRQPRPAPVKSAPVARFEFFLEAHAFGSGLGVPSLEVIQNVISTADRELEVNGKLMAHCRVATPRFSPVNSMSDDGWKRFLDQRIGHSNWSRWFGVNSGNRYNVVYWEE